MNIDEKYELLKSKLRDMGKVVICLLYTSLGYGTVASGLVDIIDNNKDKRDISIEGILVRDVKKHEHRKHADVLTDNIEDIFKKDVDVIVELLGGLHPSYEYLKSCLLYTSPSFKSILYQLFVSFSTTDTTVPSGNFAI